MHRRTQHTASHPRVGRAEEDELGRAWGIAECGRCGRTLVLGEPLHVYAGEVSCPDCADTAPERPTWIPSPVRLSDSPVRLVGAQSEPSRAA